MAKWKVRGPNGEIYSGVEADSAKEAMEKMQGGTPAMSPLTQPQPGMPAGPLAPETQTPGTTVPSTLGQMRTDMLAHGLSEADVKQGQNAMANVPGAQVVLKPGMQQGPLAPPAAPPAQPPSFQSMVEQGGMSLTPGAGKTEKGFFTHTPSGKEVAQAAVPLAVGAIVPPGRTITRGLSSLLGNIIGSAGVGAGAEMMKPEADQNILQEAALGAAKGVLPGLAQGAIGFASGPSKATLQTQKAIDLVQKSVSPEVAAVLNPEKPSSFFSRFTTKNMKRAAGDNLDTMETDISGALQGKKFSIFTGPGRTNPTFDEVRTRIKELRDVGDNAWMLGPNGRPVLTRAAQEQLNQANILEQDLLKQMPRDLAQQYSAAKQQHAKDMNAVRFIEGKQGEQRLAGGVNPADNPGLAKASQALSPLTPQRGMNAAIGAAEMVKGSPFWGMHYMGRAMEGGKQKYAGKVAESAPVGYLPQRLSVPGLAGMLGGAGAAAGQDYTINRINSTEE